MFFFFLSVSVSVETVNLIRLVNLNLHFVPKPVIILLKQKAIDNS